MTCENRYFDGFSGPYLRYTYNPNDERVLKISPAGVTKYITDGNGQVLAEYDGDGNLKFNYIYGNGQKLARVNAAGTKEYLHNDYLGSVRRISDQNGNLVWSRDYYPFGEERTASGVGNEYKFTGKERDKETELDNSWHRQYLYELGRFGQVDRAWDKYPSISPYVYVFNNPLRFTDLTGDTVEVDPELIRPIDLNEDGSQKTVDQMTPDERQRFFFQIWWKKNTETVDNLFGIGGKYETTNISFKLEYHPRGLIEKLLFPAPLYYGRTEWGRQGTNPVKWYDGSTTVIPNFGIDILAFGVYFSPDRARQGTAPHEWKHVMFVFKQILNGEAVPNAVTQHNIIGNK